MHNKLINPSSIAIIGGSNDIHKPGGKLLKNLTDGNFKGKVYVVNPKSDVVQGIPSYPSISQLPNVDLAILAIAAKYCRDTVNELADNKQTRGFIILSAGFSEESKQGAEYEKEIVDKINEVNGSLIGPNCIGVLNTNYNGIFTLPIPKLNPQGCDFISGSGATAVFIMETGIPNGLTFSSVYSVGNSAQIGVEDVVKHLDETFDPETSSKVKLLYMESINKPQMLLKHAASLIRKGCKIAAIKAGNSEAGGRAASSHTGALANNDAFVDALLNKAGIVRCYSREELTLVGGIFMHKSLIGNKIAIITHAGGPAVMLTDILSNNGLNVPKITSSKANELLSKLHPGSSVVNPIDFLATGTAEQLSHIIDTCEHDFDEIDAMCIIFGTSGLFNVTNVYNILDSKMKTCKKPIYPILPSVISAHNEIEEFIMKGRLNFPDEVAFGHALAKVYNTPAPAPEKTKIPDVDINKIRSIIEDCQDGFIHPDKVQPLLDAAKIPRANEILTNSLKEALNNINDIGFPLVMKVVGPIHKTDVKGVKLNITNTETFSSEFERMIKIEGTKAILIQPMLSGTELFIGIKRDNNFGQLVFCGLGGIFVEVLNDVQSSLSPINFSEAQALIKKLRSYKLVKGIRGQVGVNEKLFAEIITKVSALCTAAPEIFELDINPLLGTPEGVIAVDTRIRIKK